MEIEDSDNYDIIIISMGLSKITFELITGEELIEILKKAKI